MTDLLLERQLDARPLTPALGAEIDGVDLAQPLDEDVVAALRAALLRNRVIFFRDQRLDHATQIAFGRRFGDLTYAHPHDASPPDGYPEIYTVDTRRFRDLYGDVSVEGRDRSPVAGWHSDVTPAVNPPFASILRADVVPAVGGDTHWTNLVAAYEALSPALRDLADGLRAEHRYGADAIRNRRPRSDALLGITDKLVAHHPVVRVHPETNERALYLNPVFTSRILDVERRESEILLELFFAELSKPEHIVRFRWAPGSVAFWDNRSTAHLGPRDVDQDVERVLHRVTLIGDVPVGPDGTPSTLVAGAPFEAIPPIPFAAPATARPSNAPRS
jgi:alpha-ketoglutarate-dependent sulfate ester dioxygenase